MAKRAHLSKTELLKPKTKEIEVDGSTVYIRSLNAAFAISLRGKTLGDSEIFDMLSKSICDEQGELILTAEEVGQLPIVTVTQIGNSVMEFNSIHESAGKEAKDTLKNPTNVSITDSP